MGQKNSGFTLVELSIVIVIIGLLVGGIVVGQNLIHHAALETIVDDAKTYSISMQQFKDKYGELPGDFAGAHNIWPAAVNGNGNGTIEYAKADGSSGAGASEEVFQAWLQLGLASMVKGNFTGAAGPISGTDYHFSGPNMNAPSTSFDYTGWMISYVDNNALLSGHMFRVDYRNWLGMGSNLNEGAVGAPGSYADDGFLTNADAYAVDLKMDDGLPGKGNVQGMGLDTGCTDTTDSTNLAANYNLGYTGISATGMTSDHACALLFSYAMVRTGH